MVMSPADKGDEATQATRRFVLVRFLLVFNALCGNGHFGFTG
jgi:hypothetical protein